MLGAIIGDVVGSRFEWHNCRSKDFDLFTAACKPTDDSIMTLAIAKAIMDGKDDLGDRAVLRMRELGRRYPHSGYGGGFSAWLRAAEPRPYNSWGNGAAMRVSPCGLAAGSLDEAVATSKAVTEVTHNHPEGIKGAEATTVAIYLARTGRSIDEIRSYIIEHYYDIDFTLDEIRPFYEFNESCQDTVPQALEAFFESTSFEDAIRNAISVGGDSDTLAAITGGIAEAYYGIPDSIRYAVMKYLDPFQKDIVLKFEAGYQR